MAESSNLLVKVLKITKFKFLAAHSDTVASLAHVYDDNLFLMFNHIIFQSSMKAQEDLSPADDNTSVLTTSYMGSDTKVMKDGRVFDHNMGTTLQKVINLKHFP